MKRAVIHCDGSCSGNPGRGGWGAVIELEAGELVDIFGGEELTTNNRMELRAAIESLRWARTAGCQQAHIVTDSMYVKNGITGWIRNWKRNNWTTANGQPVKNKDLWEALDALVEAFPVTWDWVRGHSGHPMNERADTLANQGMRDAGSNLAKAAPGTAGIEPSAPNTSGETSRLAGPPSVGKFIRAARDLALRQKSTVLGKELWALLEMHNLTEDRAPSRIPRPAAKRRAGRK